MSSNVLEVTGVGKSFRTYAHESRRLLGWVTGRPSGYVDHWILRDISFTMKRGEGMGILGRNGAGKSTLLKLVAGTSSPTEGQISLSGRANVLELGIGFNPEFTGRENVLHSLSMMGQDRAEVLEHMPKIEAFAEIGDYFDQPLRVYSSGMYMRVAFAAATMFPPDILIVDEALSVGDALFQARCFERIKQLRDSGTALLFVSHSPGEVSKQCERAIFLDQGKLAMAGTAREVSNAYLDHLFGKGRRAAAKSVASQHSTNFAADTMDVFDTRPLYRKDEYRWGKGGARICDYVIANETASFLPVFATHQKMKVTFKVAFDRAIERPLYGLLIKSLDGAILYGTNSALATTKNPAKPAQANDVQIAAFEFPLLLNSGSYLISVGVTEEAEDGTSVPLDRRYDSIIIHVENSAPGLGPLDLGAVFDIESSLAMEGVQA